MGSITPQVVMLAGTALFLLAAAPIVLRRGLQAARYWRLRAAGEMRPFGGRTFVIDGDTVSVEQKRIRLFGIDAPEMSQLGGGASRAHLVGLICGRPVEIAPRDIDCFGRIVAVVRCEGVDLSREMAREGFARAMPYWSWAYVGAELAARWRGQGHWAACRLRGMTDPQAHRRGMKPRRGRRT